jgi:non-homologous end joining protein Ku
VARGGDEFVQCDEINPRYLIRPYYLRPDGNVGHDAFAVIRDRPLLAQSCRLWKQGDLA